MQTASDHRLAIVQEWLAAQIGSASFSLEPASEDASFRRYFRVAREARTWIVMDAPPEREDCRPFVRVAELMREAGLHVPEIIAQDVPRGLLLLSDLGTTTYLSALTRDNADRLFGDAIEALLLLQRASRPGVLPEYDEALLAREMALFPEWYVDRHLRLRLSVEETNALARINVLLVKNALAQRRVYVHRDFMPRNLMVCEPNPGVLDFQDAVYGPVSYDIVSLFRDAFLSWEEERVRGWAKLYWHRAREAGLPVPGVFDTFYRDFEWMGLQRHLKVLGIFARINYRDGKPQYLRDTPRFLNYARAVCDRYTELAPLLSLLGRIEAQIGSSAEHRSP